MDGLPLNLSQIIHFRMDLKFLPEVMILTSEQLQKCLAKFK